MQDDLIKLCPRCGGEYQLWVERCLDCDVSLVHGKEGQGAEPAVAVAGMAVVEPVIPRECVHLRTAAVAWIQRLSEDLDEAGIRHWATPPVWRRDPSLFVLPADQDAALAIDRRRYVIEVPEVAPEDAVPPPPVRKRRRAPSDDLEVKVCPSCGEEYQLHIETCVDCGVPLVRPWDLESARERAVPRVAAPVSPVPMAAEDPGGCPACGERLQEGALECPGCGLMLSQPEVCSNCGAELEAWVSRCRRCGEELFAAAEE